MARRAASSAAGSATPSSRSVPWSPSLWYPNPAGLYNPTNPLIHPFNHT